MEPSWLKSGNSWSSAKLIVISIMLASIYGSQIWRLETSLHAPDGRGIDFIDAWQIFSQDDWCLFAPIIPRAWDTWHSFGGLLVHSSEMLQTPEQAAGFCSGVVPVGWGVYKGSKRSVSGIFLWASPLAEFQHQMVVVQAECSLDWGRASKQFWIWAWWGTNLQNWHPKQHGEDQMVCSLWGSYFFSFNEYLLGACCKWGMF